MKDFMKCTGIEAVNVDRRIGERIRRRRTMLGLTQEQLAESLGISYQQVQKYETGANRVTAGRLFQIGQRLDTDIAYFVADLHPANGNSADLDDSGSGGDNISSRAVIELVRNFQSIESDSLRNSVLNLVRNMANEVDVTDESAPSVEPSIAPRYASNGAI